MLAGSFAPSSSVSEPRAGDAEAILEVARDDAAGLRDELAGEPRHHLAQRQMNGDRNDGKLVRPEHHHRLRGYAHHLGCELRQILGMAGLGEARFVEHVLGHRIGDDRAGAADMHVAHGLPDRGDRGGRARCIGVAGLGRDGDPDIDDRQRLREGGSSRRRLDLGDRHVRSDALGAHAQELGIGEDIERR